MKIAVASSGLGHVARGIETWALDTAVALHERGVDVTLFAAGECRGQTTDDRRQMTDDRGQTTDDRGQISEDDSRGSGQERTEASERSPDASPSARGLHVVVLRSLRRSDPLAKRLAGFAPGFAWRWGFKSDYGWEQLSFWWKLWPLLNRGGYDILHVQDPVLADWCRRFRRLGFVRTKEILAHGTEESPRFLEKFDYVQHLAPWHLEQATGIVNSGWKIVNSGKQKARGEATSARSSCTASPDDYSPFTIYHSRSPQSLWTAIPNFVDTGRFAPARDEEQGTRDEGRGAGGEKERSIGGTTSRLRSLSYGGQAVSSAPCDGTQDDNRLAPCSSPLSPLRARLGIPAGAFVIGTVAAVKKQHKRIDCLIREFADFAGERKRQLSVVDGQLHGRDDRQQTTDNRQQTTDNRVQTASPLPFLLVCGARTEDADELIRLADELCPGRVKFLMDVPRDEMPEVYRAMDIFVLPSLFEMMPIALLEALAMGLPVVVNKHPVLEWIVGKDEGGPPKADPPAAESLKPETGKAGGMGEDARSCGAAIEMSREGALAEFLAGLTESWMMERRLAARARAEAMFSKASVIGEYIRLYERITAASGPRIVAFTKDWDDVPTCTTHVLREMAKSMPVLWISSIGTRKPTPGHAGDVARAMRRLLRVFRGAEWKEANLRVLSPVLVPKAQSAAAIWLNRLLFAAQTRRELRRMGDGPVEYWCFVPNAVDLLPARRQVSGVRCQEERGKGERGNVEHRTSNIQHPTSNPDGRPQTTDSGAHDVQVGCRESGDRDSDAKNKGLTTDSKQRATDKQPSPLVIYYCVDDWSRFENLDTKWIVGCEEKMIRRADVILTPSRFLEEKCRLQTTDYRRQTTDYRRQTTDYRRQTTDDEQLTTDHGLQTIAAGDHSLSTIHHSPLVCYAPHGVQHDMFAAALDESAGVPADVAGLPRPVIGFYGNIYPWIDFKLVERLARARPAWSFVMIGQVYCDVSTIAGLPNVFLPGRREHESLPGYCKAFAAGMIPYDTAHPRMESVNPVKLLELLSAGVPVVCADLPEISLPCFAKATQGRLTTDVVICSTPEEWLAALDRQVARTDRREISQRAAGNDWRERVRLMRQIVVSPGRQPTNHTNFRE